MHVKIVFRAFGVHPCKYVHACLEFLSAVLTIRFTAVVLLVYINDIFETIILISVVINCYFYKSYFYLRCLRPSGLLLTSRLIEMGTTWKSHNVEQIPLTNRVRGPYCKLRTEFSSIDLTQERSARAINRSGVKRRSVTYSTDREDEVSKIFIISLLCA